MSSTSSRRGARSRRRKVRPRALPAAARCRGRAGEAARACGLAAAPTPPRCAARQSGCSTQTAAGRGGSAARCHTRRQQRRGRTYPPALPKRPRVAQQAEAGSLAAAAPHDRSANSTTPPWPGHTGRRARSPGRSRERRAGSEACGRCGALAWSEPTRRSLRA
eukprot:2209612-Prymnesium_polylepis.1